MIICFDLETTGLDKYNDRIIEIALVKFDEKTFKIIDSFHSFVNPEVEIPEVISNITNIFDDDVSGAPKIEELKKEIIEFIGNYPVLGHNVDFDINFLYTNGIDITNNIKIDTFFIANFLTYDSESLNLEMLCLYHGIEFKGAHRAINDVYATIELFKKQGEKFEKLSKDKKRAIHYLFTLTNDKNIKFLEDIFFPLFTDIVNFDIFEKIILKNINKTPYIINVPSNEQEIREDFVKILEDLGKFEHRENQILMTEEVYDSLQKGKKIVIEAPTGLGKSFAYLIPSIIYSKKFGEKVYISTKTKTLQDQLFLKDLEFLNKNLGINFSFSKLKGKRNYISLKGFFDYILLGSLTYEELNLLLKVSLWLFNTTFGELDELNFFSQEYKYLRNLNSEGVFFSDEKNQYHSYEYLTKAREALNTSDITIINHSLLFLSLQEGNTDLPNLKNLIVDEAHNIEDSVTEAMRETFSYLGIKDFLDRCEKILKIKKAKVIDFQNTKDEILSVIQNIDSFSRAYIDMSVGGGNQYKTTLLKENYYEGWSLDSYIEVLKEKFILLTEKLGEIEVYNFSKEIGILKGFFAMILEFFDKNNADNFIKILSYTDNGGIIYSYTLLNPGNFLNNTLWKNLNSCVLTSATLTIGDAFDYLKSVLNLEEFEFYSFNSDFDYKNQATLFIPTDIGDIKNNSDEISLFLKEFFTIVRGKTLTLLTNFSIIRKIYTTCNIDLKKEGINLYAQSIGGSKTKLLSFYKNNPHNSILLGTDSFWEGIDIPGEDLKYLIIHKFPFQVPSDPVFQARSKLYKDSFYEYSLPKAIIKLKQGFGRLIRTKQDKGVVILLDNRINTDWGKSFYNAFPKDINIKKGTKEQFLYIMKNK